MRVSIQTVLSKMRILSGASFFTRDEVVLNALARRIATHAADGEHVERMLDSWVTRTNEMLRIADVAALAADTRQAEQSELSQPCECCRAGGGYFELVERDGQSFARRCGCPRGQSLAALDAERKVARQKEWKP